MIVFLRSHAPLTIAELRYAAHMDRAGVQDQSARNEMEAVNAGGLSLDVAGEDGPSDGRIRAADVRCAPHDAVACPDAGIIKNVRRYEPARHVIELGPPPFREKRTIRERRLNGEEQDQEAGENASMFHAMPARVRQALLQVLDYFPRHVHFEGFKLISGPLYASGFYEDSHRTAGASAAPCTSEAKSGNYELKSGSHPELLAKLNFKGSHKGIDVISLAGIACLARVLRPGDFGFKLVKEPGPVKIPAIFYSDPVILNEPIRMIHAPHAGIIGNCALRRQLSEKTDAGIPGHAGRALGVGHVIPPPDERKRGDLSFKVELRRVREMFNGLIHGYLGESEEVNLAKGLRVLIP